jgi:UDP-glucose 4-epimerase
MAVIMWATYRFAGRYVDPVKVLVTGGAGYIGSVTVTALEAAGHVPVVLDSLVTGQRAFVAGRVFYEGDIADRAVVRRIVSEHPDLMCTIHMAARTVVPESVANPATYYSTNVAKSLELFDELARLGVPRIVFSSSASVYAPTADFEVGEESALGPASPYARTKVIGEGILRDLATAGEVRAIALRYFNPIGSDPSLRTGVYAARPTHVVGQLVRVVLGLQDEFVLTGTDLPTRDGTGIRDYVHVWDVAGAHVSAVESFDAVVDRSTGGFEVLNLGTGVGVTVRELVAAVERVSGRAIQVREAPARPGDAVGAFANVDKVREILGWRSVRTLDDAIHSAIDWGKKRAQALGQE